MATETFPPARGGSHLSLVLFLVVVIAIGGTIGYLNAPGTWFAGLAKPAFEPPNWLFAPVWLLLYVLIAIAGWRTFRAEPKGPLMTIWCLQMVLNWLWSPVFFSLHAPWSAFGIIGLLLLLIVGFIALSWQRDRISAILFVPYGLWVAFATALNFALGWLN